MAVAEDQDVRSIILLDLDGNGVGITEMSRSNHFKDASGDGLLHRTAWAAAGSAWDPTASVSL